MPHPNRRPIVGVIPAAGQGTRLGPLPCSKELMPVGTHAPGTPLAGRPKVVGEYLLDQMRDAGAQQVFWVIRPGKFDIPAYFGDGARLGLSLAYLMMGDPFGPPFSIGQALPFAPDATVLAGFPDILLQPPGAYARLIERLEQTGADVVLGVYDAPATGGAIDRVARSPGGRITRLVPKEWEPVRPPVPDMAGSASAPGGLGYLTAAWTPRFTQRLADFNARRAAQARIDMAGGAAVPEWPLGAAFAEAIDDGLHVDSVYFAGSAFLDVGTPAGWAAAPRFVVERG